jgi:hypothetical protein
MANALEVLEPFLATEDELVWGGDWNQALHGKETAGSLGGRQHLLALLDRLGLTVPTASLSHRIDGLPAIDHIALRNPTRDATRVVASIGESRLRDHDAYIVEL